VEIYYFSSWSSLHPKHRLSRRASKALWIQDNHRSIPSRGILPLPMTALPFLPLRINRPSLHPPILQMPRLHIPNINEDLQSLHTILLNEAMLQKGLRWVDQVIPDIRVPLQ
jgi:hypothetical protein